ncbi:hypothetical protein BZG00_15335 [Salinivibrio kushneri]|uniref:Nitrite reductase n=1 Tax=Salinivibrio kushneri TaxID=1908198 RepID=A0AB36JU66_9GAMM|nr:MULTISPECIES: hypothetical protein [Pseudomonadota]AGM46969.1 hypothetical protein AD45P3_00155 [Alteromonas phage vB_AmaP_AD45-P3]AGM47201.1 hypothetical protein AD45P2_00150 [Alteromonas phage vB_AmaP_AD45-P2]OOE37777.1 hypothetical protein BZG00_15335 [Salinivibrio kushneri]OOF26355.1 hypothetical protein BZJ20_16275 [Salinivibrio proteolyticus]
MDLAIIIIIVVAIAAYYGFMQSAEVVAKIATREVNHLDRQHKVSVVERTAKLDESVTDEQVEKVAALQAKLDALNI